MKKLLFVCLIVLLFVLYSDAQCNKKQETTGNQKQGLGQILDEVLPKETVIEKSVESEVKQASAGQRKTL